MIARLGEDVEEYRALWNDKERFEAATEHLLHCSCPLCGGESGFHRVGSDKRSVIPPGRKDREWFRIQKIECWDCEPGTRILPTFCVPFKSHHAQTIQNALEDSWRHNNTDNHHIFAVTVQDPESTVIWNILRVDRNDTKAFKQTLRQLEAVGIRLRAITTDGWPAIWRAVREELSNAIHLLCYFHAKKNVYETLEKYRKAKKLPANAPELAEWRRAFFQVLDAPTPKLYRTCLRKLTRRIADEPILLARCKSLQKKSHYNIWRLRSPSLAATSSMVELTFKLLTRKVESLYSFQRSKCNAAQKSLTVWALVRDFFPYLPGAKYAGQSPAQLAGIDLQGLPWLQYVNLKLSEVT